MKLSRINLLFIAGLLTFIPSVYGQNISYSKALLTKLFTTDGYDKRIRPVQDMANITSVSVALMLSSIIELDEVEEKLVTTASLHISWNDTNLVWDPSQYDNTDILFLPQADVWKPDMVLLNSFKDYKELGGNNLQVLVESNGLVKGHVLLNVLRKK